MSSGEFLAPDDLKADLMMSSNNGNASHKVGILDEKPPVSELNIKYIYTKEQMLQLRSSPKSIPKPCCLDEDFFTREGIWDPEAWHKSSTSRSGSPAVEGKIASEGKKIDIVDDQIELAPRRKSFHQGCQVRSSTERSEKPGTRAIFEKKSRLTGRATAQRKSLESKYREQNDEKPDKRNHPGDYTKHDEIVHSKENRPDEKYKDNQRDRNERSYERTARDRNEVIKKERKEGKEGKDDRARERGISFKNDKENYKPGLKGGKYRSSDHVEEGYPEWMSDAPTSQLQIIELGGFKDIEEEKKAYAKKKNLKKCESPVTENEVKAVESKKVEVVKKECEKKSATPSDKMFDINEFFNEVNYYPPHLFHEDMVNGDGVKSRFTQWFQNQSRSSSRNSCSSKNNGSRPPSAGLLPDEIFSGRSQSPVVPYFTPIQPAINSSIVTANTQPQSSNILNIIQKQKHSAMEPQKKEIRGRLNVLELEQNERFEVESANNQSAFELFVQSMKASGQLPEKPAPVITGLPDHLLPKPPKATSPTFEKLKRALSRSPSPVQIVQAVSTVANILASNPTIDTELAFLHSMDHLKPNQSLVTGKPCAMQDSFELNNSVFVDLNSSSQQKKNATQFMPTSVLKKLHSEKSLEVNDSMITHPDHSLTNLTTDYPDIINSAKNDPIESELDRLLSTPERSYKTLPKESSVLFHSLPPTPQQLPSVASHSISAPGTPGHREHNDPPPVHRFPIVNSKLSDAYQSSILNAPSAFDPINVNKNSRVGVIGSRPNKDSVAESPIIPYNNESSWGFADPRLAPGNGAVRSAASSLPNNITPQLSNPLKPQSRHPVMQSTPSHAPQSQQQQLLHAQRMAQIQQAQLHQQQKLQQIVQQANQQKIKQTEQDKHFPVGIRPLLPDPEPFPQHRHPGDLRYQQQQQEQIQVFRQKQQTNIQPQPPTAAGQFPMNNNFNSNNGRSARSMFPTHQGLHNNLQLPLQQALGLPPTFGRSPQNVAGVNLAAQALVQQQLLERARLFAQAHLMQQQPQIMQAALMAQAALVRGQAQAAAMMQFNPRNIQAMAEQMGIRTNKQNISSNSSSNKNSPHFSTTPTSNGVSDDFLSKWFGKDILQQVPVKTAELKGANVVSVEDVEKVQRAS